MNKTAGLLQKADTLRKEKDGILATAATQVRGLAPEESERIGAIDTEVAGLTSLIKQLNDHAAEMAKSALPVATESNFNANKSETLKPTREKGHGLSHAIRSLAATRGDIHRAAEYCERVFGDGEVAKALAAGSGSAGGFTVPENLSQELIEFLRPASVVRKMGANAIPLPNGNLSIPKIAGGTSAGYIGENQNIPKTEASFGQVKLSARKLAALTPISNDLIRFSSQSVDNLIRNDLVAAIAQAEDSYFIRSDGSGAGPKGLRYWAPIANQIKVNATVNLANVTADTSKVMLALMNADVRMIKPGWLMSPRSKVFLEDLRDGNGNKAFPEVADGMFRGFPIGMTTKIPINLAVTGTNESEIYFADFADVVIGEVPGMVIDVSTEAAYHDGSGVVAAFSVDQTVIRVIAQNDLVVRHTESVAVLIDVDWGA